jgi:hypothetical protein
MINVHEENKCLDIQAKFNDLRDKFYQFKAARSSPTHFSHTYIPHKTCSYCFNPYHSDNNCSSWGQFSNFSYEYMNTSFSNPGCDSNSNFYNLNWSNQSNFSWLVQSTGNYAPQFQELHLRLSVVRSSSSTTCLSSATTYTSVFTRRHT